MNNTTINYYNKNSKQLVNRYESVDMTDMQKLLVDSFNKDSSLLEIGCGSGRDASFMVKNNYNIIAIDSSLNMINEAIKMHSELNTKLLVMKVPEELNFDIKFDGIYSIATLMHLSKDNLNYVVSKVYNLLNKNGKFIISVSLFRDDINSDGFDNKGRFFLILTLDEWIDIFKNIGFNIIKTRISKDGLNRDGVEWLTLVVKK